MNPNKLFVRKISKSLLTDFSTADVPCIVLITYQPSWEIPLRSNFCICYAHFTFFNKKERQKNVCEKLYFFIQIHINTFFLYFQLPRYSTFLLNIVSGRDMAITPSSTMMAVQPITPTTTITTSMHPSMDIISTTAPYIAAKMDYVPIKLNVIEMW